MYFPLIQRPLIFKNLLLNFDKFGPSNIKPVSQRQFYHFPAKNTIEQKVDPTKGWCDLRKFKNIVWILRL